MVGCHADRQIKNLFLIDVVIASCVDGHSYASTTYRIENPTQWETVVSKDVLFYEDWRYSSSQNYPLVIGENVDVVPETDSET